MIILPGRLPAKKTPGYERINASHPLAQYVMYAYFMQPWGNDKLYDHGPFGLHASIIGTPYMFNGLYGKEKYFTRPNYAQVAYHPRLNPTNKSISLIARIRSLSVGSSDQYVCIRDWTGVNLAYYLSYAPKTGYFNQPGMGFYSGAIYATGINTELAGDSKYHVLAGVCKNLGSASSQLSYYIDGELDATATVAAAMPISSNVLNLGMYVAGDYGMTGDIEFLMAFDTALSADWIKVLSMDPYSLIMPSRRMWSALTAGAPGGGAGSQGQFFQFF